MNSFRFIFKFNFNFIIIELFKELSAVKTAIVDDMTQGNQIEKIFGIKKLESLKNRTSRLFDRKKVTQIA